MVIILTTKNTKGITQSTQNFYTYPQEALCSYSVSYVVNGYYFNHKEHKGNYTENTDFYFLIPPQEALCLFSVPSVVN